MMGDASGRARGLRAVQAVPPRVLRKGAPSVPILLVLEALSVLLLLMVSPVLEDPAHCGRLTLAKLASGQSLVLVSPFWMS